MAVPPDEVDPERVSGSDESSPWEMPLVVHAPAESSLSDACQAAASATVRLLAESESLPAGHPDRTSVDAWLTGRFRKVVRRAKSSRDLDRARSCAKSWSASSSAVTAAAFIPLAPPLPRDIARLQVASWPSLRAVEEEARPSVAVVCMSPHVELSPGKSAAQAAHAAQLLWQAAPQTGRDAWARSAFSVRVVFPSPQEWASAVSRAQVEVRDAGFTEVPAGTRTCVAHWDLPLYAS